MKSYRSVRAIAVRPGKKLSTGFGRHPIFGVPAILTQF